MSRLRDSSPWSSPAAVTVAARKAWTAGDVLRATAGVGGLLPLRVRLSGPTRDDLADHWAEVREWAQTLRSDAVERGWRLEERRVTSRLLGPQELPYAGWLDGLDVVLKLLGPDEQDGALRFTHLLHATKQLDVTEDVWQAGRAVALAQPLDILAAGRDWPPLVSAADWLVRHPRPGIGLRELPVAGAHTKLLEQNRALARALFDAALPAEAIDTTASDLPGRYGFKDGPQEVLLRGAGPLLGVPWLAEVMVRWPLEALAGLDPQATGLEQVWVVENKTPLRRMPLAPGSLLIWGAGYAAEATAQACPWWDQVPVFYWGDVDTHGLVCLARVLRHRSQIRPVLMDETTLLAHRQWWGLEDEQAGAEACEELLAPEQARLLAGLRDGTWGNRLRLEQEHLDVGADHAVFVRYACDEGKNPVAIPRE